MPPECSWQRLLDTDGDELEKVYRHILEQLGRKPGTLGVVFRKAQNRIQDPAKLALRHEGGRASRDKPIEGDG